MVARQERPELLTVNETAGILRETTRSIYGRIHRGELGAYRVGTRKLLVNRDDVYGLLRPIEMGVDGQAA